VELESFIEAERQRYNRKSAGLVGMDVEKIFWAAQIIMLFVFAAGWQMFSLCGERGPVSTPTARAGGRRLRSLGTEGWFNRGFSKPINGAGPALFDD